jgi:hypothetical protein
MGQEKKNHKEREDGLSLLASLIIIITLVPSSERRHNK